MEKSKLFWFPGYWEATEATQRRFTADGRYFLTGDTAHIDEASYVFFQSRADDVITSAGYRIGPFEVESCLLKHPAVAEAAAIGLPDPLRGSIVAALVVLRSGHEATKSLEDELQEAVRHGVGKHAYPREIRFVDALPKTPSGKIQRYVLRGEQTPKVTSA